MNIIPGDIIIIYETEYVVAKSTGDTLELRVKNTPSMKNNPLPEDDRLHHRVPEHPHQFKVGDWVKVIRAGNPWCGEKGKVSVVGNCIRVNIRQWGITVDPEDIEPATRLKRKEIRERLEKLKDPARFGYSIQDDIDKLIEEI